MSFIVFLATVLTFSKDNILVRIILPLYLACIVLFPLVFLVNVAISACVDLFGGDIVGRCCRNKVFAYILMINLFNLTSSENRDRTSTLLQRIKQELEDPDV